MPSRSKSSGSAPAPHSSALPNAWRIEVFRDPERDDPSGSRALSGIAELGIHGVESARSGRGYLLSPELEREVVERIAAELLVDPVLERARITPPRELPQHSAGVSRVLVARKPGVMDPVALTVESTLARSGLAGSTSVRALTYQAWELGGTHSARDLDLIARELFANDVIDDVHIDDESLHFGFPTASGQRGARTIALRGASDRELLRISSEGSLSLSLLEMQTIRAHYVELARDPTDCELETLAQTWSEHCKHKTFTGRIEFTDERGEHDEIDNLLKHTIKAATLELAKPWCVSVFHDNAGIVEFEPGWHVCFKVETHNHPSAIDPYGGAGTGVGGVIRDILGVGLGAKPIANTDAFFVGPLDLPASELPEGCMHPRRILRGVVAGVRDYGNRMGIPTVSGGLWIDPRYVGNPLVYCGTVGLMPADCATKSIEPGDLIVVVGGRTGRDGIHGATFSSVELHDQSVVVSSASVQIGDPITEKRVQEALLRARDRKLFRAVTDCGAGGLSSAVGEMGAGGLGEQGGARVSLELVPLKYPGLSPAEIWISEAQERMVLAVPPQKLDELLATFAAEACEAAVIGEFTATGMLQLSYEGESVGELAMSFLHDGTPRPLRKAIAPARVDADPGCPPCGDANAMLLALLGSPSLDSREWIVRQYDHEVQGTSVIKPLVGAREDGPSDAAVLQPLPDSRRGLALACGANPRYGVLDAWAMASAAIDEALRNVVAVGGDPTRTAILDNFSWGNCEKPEQLGSLVQAARACYATAVAFETPFISGKDSLNNEFRLTERDKTGKKTGERTIAIPPTLLVSALALVPDVSRTITLDLKRPGNPIYLVGMTHGELGGSHYLGLCKLGQGELDGGRVPRPDLALAPKHLRALFAAISSGCVRACHDLSEGGLAVAAAEMAFAGDLGLELELAAMVCAANTAGYDVDTTRLFSESCTRFLVEVTRERAGEFEGCFAGLDCARIGNVTSTPRLAVRGITGRSLIDVSVDALRAAHQGGFRG